MNAELKRREHIVILDVTECLMAEEVIFCHNKRSKYRFIHLDVNDSSTVEEMKNKKKI
jgi:hypothetical protein